MALFNKKAKLFVGRLIKVVGDRYNMIRDNSDYIYIPFDKNLVKNRQILTVFKLIFFKLFLSVSQLVLTLDKTNNINEGAL